LFCSSAANDCSPLSRKTTQGDFDASTELGEQEKGLRGRFSEHKKTVSFLNGEVPNTPLRFKKSILRRTHTTDSS